MDSHPTPFDYSLNYKKLNLRQRAELYRVGKGEQGVLLVEPYKSELLPLWRFKTPDIAQKSARDLYKRFRHYKKEKDFIGMDMARKFIQMGYTRSMRYAHHKTGKKYLGPVPKDMKGRSGSHSRPTLPDEVDPLKRLSAIHFKKIWKHLQNDRLYQSMKKDWQSLWG